MNASVNELTFAPFETGHLDEAVALSRHVSWPHRREDWALVLKVSRGVVALSNGRVVATAVCTPFGKSIASINMIIVHAELRGRGLGRRLMQEVMSLAGERTQRLVATEDGRPLYEKLGFVATGTIAQHQGIVTAAVPMSNDTEWAEVRDGEAIAQLDKAAFGADRGTLLSCLLQEGRAAVLREQGRVVGVALCRPFGRGSLIGPVAARNLDEAKSLVATHMAAHRGSFLRIDAGTETGLVGWLTTLGLSEVGHGTVMYRGAQQQRPGTAPSIFALASQALG